MIATSPSRQVNGDAQTFTHLGRYSLAQALLRRGQYVVRKRTFSTSQKGRSWSHLRNPSDGSGIVLRIIHGGAPTRQRLGHPHPGLWALGVARDRTF